MLAALAFGIGDVLTTGLGLWLAVLTETGPVAAPLVEWFGPGVMLPAKAVTFGGCYALWRLVPRPHSVGVPLGLTALGVSVTCWSLHLLVAVRAVSAAPPPRVRSGGPPGRARRSPGPVPS